MMMKLKDKQTNESNQKAYEAPQIIYENEITTRAGSPLGNPNGADGIDPADLFDN
jgi:hypothetical protein